MNSSLLEQNSTGKLFRINDKGVINYFNQGEQISEEIVVIDGILNIPVEVNGMIVLLIEIKPKEE